MTSSNFDWSDIARAYSKGECTVTQICEQFKVSRSSLYRQARIEKWPKRTHSNRYEQQDFLDHMFCVLNKQLDQVDNRITAQGAVDAVALGNIAKTFEKLTELRNANKINPKAKPKNGAAAALRELLAQNFERLNETG